MNFLRVLFACLCLRGLSALRRSHSKSRSAPCGEAASGGGGNGWWWQKGNDCSCPSGQVVVGPDCVGSDGYQQYYNSAEKMGKGCRCENLCAYSVAGAEKTPWWRIRGSDCQCPSGQVVLGVTEPNLHCAGKTGFDDYFSGASLVDKDCRCGAKTSQVGQGDDGNPFDWDRYRRCDDTGYDPPCGLCEGVGGNVWADDKRKVDLAYCEVVATLDEIDPETVKRPIWGADFTVEKSYEILIGIKTDAACFQAFPNNDSTAPMCYKPQEVKITSDMARARTLRLDLVQGGNAWGVVGNVSSTILHQYGNMWIFNRLPLGITQTICVAPREGADPGKEAVGPLQFNWTNVLRFMGRERIAVEYDQGMQTLDHWIYGPHHVWSDPATGLVVRMWQPFNGLQVFPPGAFRQGTDPSMFSELLPDGSQAPGFARPGGSTFRIKCDDNGFSLDAPPATPAPSALELAAQPVGHNQASSKDLKRARQKVPGAAYKGSDFSSMSQTLNKWLLKHAPNSRECDQWTVEELQKLQVELFQLRDQQLDHVYQGSKDNRRMPAELAEATKEWEELNSLASQSPELARMHRDGHCHEAVMWYVHHLPEVIRSELKDKIALPLLSLTQHDLSSSPESAVQPVALAAAKQRVHKAYTYQVSCAACHSQVFPDATTEAPETPAPPVTAAPIAPTAPPETIATPGPITLPS